MKCPLNSAMMHSMHTQQIPKELFCTSNEAEKATVKGKLEGQEGKSGPLQEGFQILCNVLDFKPLGEKWLSNIRVQRDHAATWVVSATTLLIGEKITEVCLHPVYIYQRNSCFLSLLPCLSLPQRLLRMSQNANSNPEEPTGAHHHRLDPTLEVFAGPNSPFIPDKAFKLLFSISLMLNIPIQTLTGFKQRFHC